LLSGGRRTKYRGDRLRETPKREVSMRRLVVTVAVLLLVVAALAFPSRHATGQVVSDGQRLAMYTKPSVVRIWDGYVGTFVDGNGREYPQTYVGSGSGSFIDPNGYILTNAHVTDATHQGDDFGRKMLFQQLVIQVARSNNDDPRTYLNNPELLRRIDGLVSLRNFQHIHHVVIPDGTAMPFEIKAFGAPAGEGKDVSVIKIEVKNAPVLKLGDSERVQLQDHISVVGYPAAADTFDSGILSSKSALEASITDGKVSAKKNAADGSPILQVSAPATHGNSGGPVLNDAGEVVGMLTFRGDTVNGNEVSGFAFVVSASTMMEFVKQAGANNALGIVDQKYREGLDFYWGGYYTKAIERFEEVRRLFPQHSEVERLIQQSQQAKAEGKEKWDFPIWIPVVGVLLVGLFFVVVIAGAGVFFLRRGKKPAAARPAVVNPQPVGLPHGFPSNPPAGVSTVPLAGGDKTVAISAPSFGSMHGSAAQSLGTIVCTQGILAGQRFEIRPEGVYIGRDGTLSQVVISDARVSKRHVWIGPRNGRVAVVDQQSTNGTFLNVPNSQRLTEAVLNPGDTVILSEADVARFQYQR
jgi:S1-C subfamily serine protease